MGTNTLLTLACGNLGFNPFKTPHGITISCLNKAMRKEMMMSLVHRVQNLFEFIPPGAKFKEFEQRLKFKPRLKYGWFHLKLYSILQYLSRHSIETGFWQI